MLGWLKKHGIDIDLPHTCHTSYRLFKLWERLLTSHFHVMNADRTGIQFPKRFHRIFYAKNANYDEQDLMAVRRALKSPFYCLRYVKLLFNKYVICWFNLSYLRSVASVMIFSLSPSLARKLKGVLGKIRRRLV